MEKQYYWAKNLKDYTSDNQIDNPHIIEIKKLNYFIGKNNAGKSRFLRGLYLNDVFIVLYRGNIEDKEYLADYELFYPYDELYELVDDLMDILSRLGFSLQCRDMRFTYADWENWTEEFQFNTIENVYKSTSELIGFCKDYISLDNIVGVNDVQDMDNRKSLSRDIDIIQNYIEEKIYLNKIYIPSLRGMRPVQKTGSPYLSRTEKDYFSGENCNEKIITGESLFQELTEHLLGEPEQRQLIADYQKLLSQYFFDNQEITLIPKHGTDVVHIKIGNEKQFPIYELGDGLQQAIILTYPAFLNNQDTHMFFIEEPELHMHAGMVRQLMNFYLNETKHYYFFTTHSNHLLDMADESDEVIIQKFVKQTDEQQKTSFQIYRCDRDRDLLASLGVKPSSVYLANCTIWVEGITDRLYLLKYMEKYLQELQDRQPEKYLQYRRFMPNYHYAFVEYSGGNIVHWDFSDDVSSDCSVDTSGTLSDFSKKNGMSAKGIVSDMLLIADGDNRDKATRLPTWNKELGKNMVVLKSKEMENTLPFDVIVEVAKARFARMQAETKTGFEIGKLDLLDKRNYFVHKTKGIGFLLDEQIRLPEADETKSVFTDGGVGTIKDKLKFCREVIQYFDNNPDWKLTRAARVVCEKIYRHIESCNR